MKKKKVYKGTWGKWSVLPFCVDIHVMYSCLDGTNFFWGQLQCLKKEIQFRIV